MSTSLISQNNRIIGKINFFSILFPYIYSMFNSNIHIDGDIFISKLTGKRLQVHHQGAPLCRGCVFFGMQCSLYKPLILWDVRLCVDLHFTFTEVEKLYDIPEELGSFIQTTLEFIYHNRKK